MNIEDDLSGVIRKHYEIIYSLESEYRKYDRHFTLDGHLLGSIGEVYAAEHYNIKLFKSSYKGHDGITKDEAERLVQIKVTQSKAKKKVIGLSSKPEWLLVLQVNEQGEFSEIYNGPGGQVWDLVKDKPKPDNGQYQIALSRLKTLNSNICPDNKRRLMADFCEPDPEKIHDNMLRERVQYLKNTEKGRREMCEVFEEIKQEGAAQERLELIRNALQNSTMSVYEILDFLGIPETDRAAFLEQINQPATV